MVADGAVVSSFRTSAELIVDYEDYTFFKLMRLPPGLHGLQRSSHYSSKDRCGGGLDDSQASRGLSEEPASESERVHTAVATAARATLAAASSSQCQTLDVAAGGGLADGVLTQDFRNFSNC